MQEKGLIFTRSSSGLIRDLTWWDVFLMVIATPAASGILYYSVSTASTYPGASIPLAFLIGMLMFLPICATISMISASMPRSGSLYVAISRLIDPTIGYLGAFLFFFGYCLTIGVLGYIISGIIGGILITSGLASGLSILGSIGSALQSNLWATLGGIAWVLVFWVITLIGIKPFKNTMRILFAIPMIATIIAIVYFFISSPLSAQIAFDRSWGAGAYQRILDLARNNGWGFSSFSWASTIGVLLVVIWAYGGIEMASYATGEVKTPRKSMIKGFVWGALAVGLLYIILAYSVYIPFGRFIGAYDFMFKNHPDLLKSVMSPISPSIPFYLTSIIRNPWIAVILASSLVLWFVNTIPPFFLGISRLIFALAMDRAIPEKLADINQKNGAPTWATHITALVAICGVLLNLFGVTVVLATINFSIFFVVWLYGLSAMILPYRRPDIYEKSPVRLNVFGIPLITILGFITFAIGWFIIFFTISQMKTSVALTLIIAMLIGMVIYFYQQAKNIKKGVELSKIYSEIPPE